MTIDRLALFRDLTTRNHMRLTGGLAPLDIRGEYDFRVALAAEMARREDLPALTIEFAADRALIETQVIADVTVQHGRAFRHTSLGLTTITLETQKRFRKFLLEVQGIETEAPSKFLDFVEGSY